MNPITALHKRAMETLDTAASLRREGNTSEADIQLQAAYELEAEAANSLIDKLDAEPSRSILYRSAASLAYQCDLFPAAEKLIYRALSGQPPLTIERELQELLEQVTFTRHLQVRGVDLLNTDIQVVLEGKGIGYGIAPASEVTTRVDKTNLLLFRTAERLANEEYREAGRPRNEVRERAEAFMSVARAASFAFSLRIGSVAQMSFADPSEGLLDELLDCLALVEEGNQPALRSRIPNAAYYNNFISLAGSILPDGETVSTVGFTVERPSGTRMLALRQTATKVKEQFAPIVAPATQRRIVGQERPVQLTGQLRFADSVRDTNRIQIVSEQGKASTVYVPEGMMADIVKPLWDTWVVVDGLRMGKTTTLISIRRLL